MKYSHRNGCPHTFRLIVNLKVKVHRLGEETRTGDISCGSLKGHFEAGKSKIWVISWIFW